MVAGIVPQGFVNKSVRVSKEVEAAIAAEEAQAAAMARALEKINRRGSGAYESENSHFAMYWERLQVSVDGEGMGSSKSVSAEAALRLKKEMDEREAANQALRDAFDQGLIPELPLALQVRWRTSPLSRACLESQAARFFHPSKLFAHADPDDEWS